MRIKKVGSVKSRVLRDAASTYGSRSYNTPAPAPKAAGPKNTAVPSGVNRKDWLARQAKIEERQGQVKGARILRRRMGK